MTTTVHTSYGTLEGTRGSDGVTRFLGVPYAAAPVGDRRMRRPEKPEPWTGTRSATEYGPTATRSDYPAPFNTILSEPIIEGDDYLNLNVWTPDTSGRAPVFVWIHGGAFTNGSGAVPEYDGSAFARDGVVCVTINYRLGAEGFLYTGEGDTDTNLGLRDQIAALEWVRDEIAAFGGDPAKVTIGGESAGGMSVGCLLSSPLAAGLFRGAVLQSGAGHHAIGRTAAEFVAKDLARRLGVEPTREAIANARREEVLAAQAAISAEIQMLRDPKWQEIVGNLMPFEPLVDGDVLTALPCQAIADGAGRDVRVLIGANSDEQLLFLVPTGATAIVNDEILQMTARGYGFDDPDAAIAVYAKEHGQSPGHLVAALATDWFFRIPAIRLAEAHQGHAETYMYEFAWRSNHPTWELGACHALELPFVFDNLGTPTAESMTGPNAPASLATEMHRAWVQFVVSGDPGWSPYEPGRRTVHIFDLEPANVDDPGGDLRMLWEGRR